MRRLCQVRRIEPYLRQKCLSLLNLTPYEICRLDALCAGHEDVVKKSDKVKLWNDLEEILPPFGANKTGKDPVGLISLVDRAYMRAFKLHKVYNSAMRFHCAARWLAMFQSALAESRKEGWREILTFLAQSETGTYCLTEDRIALVTHRKRVKVDAIETPSLEDSQEKLTTPQLF